MKPGFLLLPFFLLVYAQAHSSEPEFPTGHFQKVFSLDIDTTYFNNPVSAYSILADNQEDFLFLLVTDDINAYNSFQLREERRKKAILLSESSDHIKNYCISEIELQWALLRWRFGDYVKSGLLLRKAYKRLLELKDKHPDFVEVNKSLGLLHILLSAIPEEYNWLIKIFGFNNNLALGIRELKMAAETENHFQLESQLLLSYVHLFVLGNEDIGQKLISRINSVNNLSSLVYLVICHKSGMNDAALNEVYKDKWIYPPKYLRPAISLLRGEFHLKKLEYDQAKLNIKNFLLTYPGKSFRKNARLKLFYAHYLSGDEQAAKKSFLNHEEGSDFSTSDIYASELFEDGIYPDKELLKARLLFDGGYFEEALKEAQIYAFKSSAKLVHKYEYYYRLGRIHQKLGSYQDAIQAFEKCVEIQGKERYYFAPNACLQLGRIYSGKEMQELALKWFNAALEYKKYAYRRSIEHQAKSAINEIHSP